MTTPPELPAKKLSIAAGEMAIDEPALTELVEALGSNGFIAALNHFERDARSTLEQLKELTEAGDHAGLRKAAHRLKGLFLQFGAPEAGRLAAEAETSADEFLAGSIRSLAEFSAGAIPRVVNVSREIAARTNTGN